MSLKNKPYLPLYIQDYLTDEKLNECNPASQGIYIKIMCLMTKSKEYGVILLEQKYQQNSSKVENFACKLVKHLTFTKEEIESALDDLIKNDVLQLNGDRLEQKRMIRDAYISDERAKAGKKGGDKAKFAKGFAKAKNIANTDIDNDIENDTNNFINGVLDFTTQAIESISAHMGNLAPKKTKSLVKNSADTIDKLVRIDGFELDYIKSVIEWAMNDDFWKKNALSLASLRTKSKSNDLTKFQNMANSYERSKTASLPERTKNNIVAGDIFIERMKRKYADEII